MMYGLGAVKFKGTLMGYIEEDSFDWGGSPGEITEIKASQVKGAAVKALPKSNGTIKPTFDLIQLEFGSLVSILGGKLLKDAEENVTGWEAPSEAVVVEGPLVIETDSGHRVTIPNGMFQGNISGPLSMSAVSKIKCTITPQKPSDGAGPYKIEEIFEGA